MNLTNHPGMWLADDAAASLDRWETRYGALSLSDAGRTDDEQRELIRRWNEGGKYNRPPYLYLPAWPSPHQSGLALDTPEHDRFGATCGEYGWRFNIPSDPVHAIYESVRDEHLNDQTDADPVPAVEISKGSKMRVVQNWGDGNMWLVVVDADKSKTRWQPLSMEVDRDAIVALTGQPILQLTGQQILNIRTAVG